MYACKVYFWVMLEGKVINKERTGENIYLVLVPHRDVRLVLRKYSDELFKAGCAGAYHFPWVAPLAELREPLDSGELKTCAGAVRDAAGREKICAAQGANISLPGVKNLRLFGLQLGFVLPQNALGKKASGLFSPAVIGIGLLTAGEEMRVPAPPQVSFRAAAVANMFWQPLKTTNSEGAAGFEWEIGPLYWVPGTNIRGVK